MPTNDEVLEVVFELNVASTSFCESMEKVIDKSPTGEILISATDLQRVVFLLSTQTKLSRWLCEENSIIKDAIEDTIHKSKTNLSK